MNLTEELLDELCLFALGMLEADHQLELSKHLPFCSVCQGEVHALYEDLGRIALASSPLQPPEGTREKVIENLMSRLSKAGPAEGRS